VLECPWHGARFDVRTGGCLAGPATDAIATWPVTVVDGRVYVGARRAPVEEAP
jgi:nitrite reductase/ring-hydroxylating ferredoxin subunit